MPGELIAQGKRAVRWTRGRLRLAANLPFCRLLASEPLRSRLVAGLVLVLPPASYLLLARVTLFVYRSCCAGIPDDGPVPVQYLPLFLIGYPVPAPDLWLVASSMFVVPGVVAGRLVRGLVGWVLALAGLAGVLALAGLELWPFMDSFSRFLAELDGEPWHRSHAVGPFRMAVGAAALLIAVGLLGGSWWKTKRSG